MKILFEEIPDDGLSLERELGLEYLGQVLGGEGPEIGFSPAAPARLAARFDKVGDKLLLKGRAQVGVKGSCKRCLAEVVLEVPVQFQLNLVPRASPQGPDEGEDRRERREEGSLELDSADEEPFDGREIDLGGIVREQILLALPMDGLCSETCKGLCPVCGQDLNVKECGCQRTVADPRWAALKNIKLT
jgi:uncharacterized protein